MKVLLVVPSIGSLDNLHMFKDQFLEENHEIKISIIDEGDESIREKNHHLLDGLEFTFYGPGERKKWFKTHFGGKHEHMAKVIPDRCHAETSFGFLLALENGFDIVIELDDDVFPVKDENLIQSHIQNLEGNKGVIVNSVSKWYNTLDALEIGEGIGTLFPRGHPYAQNTRKMDYEYKDIQKHTVLNMGHWSGNLDFDAPTLLYHGALDGRYIIEGIKLKHTKVIVGSDIYCAVCSMNTSFIPKIIPAFYQMYMNYDGIDRFDDIWSGLFLKKVVDFLDDSISLGAPIIYHDKRPRSVFKDLRNELEGIVMNETLWRIIDSIALDGNDYHSCYNSLIGGIETKLDEFMNKKHKDFMRIQVEKMRLWLQITDTIM